MSPPDAEMAVEAARARAFRCRISPMSKDPQQTPAPVSSKPEIEAFVERVRALGPATAPGTRGRLIFALDATMSRQPTWDTACALQADMFREAASVGGLDIQLVYFRGLSECRASGWVAGSDRLAELMSRIDCRGGQTQIGKVLSHARQGTRTPMRTGAGVRWGRHGRADRPSLPGCGRVGTARRADFHVSGRQRSRRGKCLSRDRAAVARRLLPFRRGIGASTWRVAARCRSLCGGGHQGACRSVGEAIVRRTACYWPS